MATLMAASTTLVRAEIPFPEVGLSSQPITILGWAEDSDPETDAADVILSCDLNGNIRKPSSSSRRYNGSTSCTPGVKHQWTRATLWKTGEATARDYADSQTCDPCLAATSVTQSPPDGSFKSYNCGGTCGAGYYVKNESFIQPFTHAVTYSFSSESTDDFGCVSQTVFDLEGVWCWSKTYQS